MHFRLKPTLLYLLFVGLPMLGVLALLKIGQNVAPTMSIGGHWDVAAQGPFADALSCRKGQPAAKESSALDIKQSGRNVTLAIPGGPGGALKGGIDHDVLVATRLDGAPNMRLQAKVNRGSEPEALSGTVEFVNCPAPDGNGPVTVPIRATRTKSSREGAR